ncbi:MAG: polysaccharide deacetylase family protein [Clostridiales bacterium]|nr:polysaccharide deacetylase family protein [Eubacteriales bacterium]MCI5765957.1 polysaccharide deacetylase family protein [Clostridiales bacterium]MDD7122981.1 polysaccharide deacetylase family protein [Clostridiales bacterium]MDY5469827.1 polysaccharide deacetylase family protein [Eubacteriales bacterium]
MIKQTVITPRPQTVKKRRPRGAGWLAAHAVSLLSFALLLTISAAYVGALPDTVSVVSGKRELPIYCVNRDDNKISISFDAAWGGDKTLGILDLLDEYNIKTTFFLVDIWTQKYPELVKEIVARGHEIGNHSTSHPQMSKLNETQIAKELNTQADNVLAIAGVRPVLFRPPYGDYNNRVITTARAQGFVPIQWSVDSLDWKNRGAQEIINRATKVKSGDIVLFHNDSQYILDALPAVLKYYAENGYSVVPISEILLTGETTIDIQGRQQPVSTKIPEV